MLKIILILGLVNVLNGLDNGLARTPPMGWMSWERFRCVTDCEQYPDECINEKLFQNMADRLVADGYAAAGYEYIIIDDCWLAMERDENGLLQPDPVRFPNGIKALADYIHGKGLKFGIYEDYGTHTCAGYPGILGHLETDANTFAKWDVDYIKLDGCYADPKEMPAGYAEFGKYLNKTGRPIVYSCSYPAYSENETDYAGVAEHCNLWRNYGDVDDSWDSVLDIIQFYSNNQNRFGPYNGPGHWNDPDMLVIGNFGLSLEQAKAQMAIWSIFSSPLIMSVDLRTIRPEFREILTNKDVIAINQDPLGIQGRMVYSANNILVFTKPIQPFDKNNFAIAFLSNRTDGTPHRFSVGLNTIGLTNTNGYVFNNIYEKNRPVIVKDGNITVDVNPTGVVLLKAIAL